MTIDDIGSDEAKDIAAQIMRNWKDNAERLAGLSGYCGLQYFESVARNDVDGQVMYGIASSLADFAPPEEYDE